VTGAAGTTPATATQALTCSPKGKNGLRCR
jgi:hypothetical protein